MSAILERFSNKLRVTRLEKGLNQENLAKMLGLSVTGYSKIERGETDVSLSRVEQIAGVLKVDISTILEISTNYVFNNIGNGSGHQLGTNQNVVYHQFDKTIMDGLMTRLAQYESELADMKGTMKRKEKEPKKV